MRTPGKLTVVDSRLHVMPRDIQRADSIHAAVPGHDAVLSDARSLGPTTLLSDAAREIVAAMQAHGVRGIIWQSSLGVGETRGHLGPFYNWLLIPLLLRQVFADKERQEAIVRATPFGLDDRAAPHRVLRLSETPGRQEEELEALRLGLCLGLTLIDTAEMYGDSRALRCER